MPASRLELSTGARDFRRGLFTRPLFCDGAKTHARTMASSIKGEPHYITARSDSSIIKHTPEAFNREELSLRFPPYSHQGGPCATGGGAAVVAHGRQGRIKCGQQRGNGTSAPLPARSGSPKSSVRRLLSPLIARFTDRSFPFTPSRLSSVLAFSYAYICL